MLIHPIRLASFVAAMLFSTVVVAQIHVDASRPSGGDGIAWASAYNDLQVAFDAALSAPIPDLDAEFWVADGTYYPTRLTDPTDPRSATFEIINRWKVYGGFLGVSTQFPNGETSLTDRNPEQNLTILSGDLGYANASTRDPLDANGTPINFPNAGTYADNAYHVVTVDPSYDGAPMRISGLVVRLGFADGQPSPFHNDEGGGMRLRLTSNSGQIGPFLERLRVEYNFSTFRGAGMTFASKATVVPVSNCRVEHNFNTGFEPVTSTIGGGGGIATVSTELALQNCTFFDNHTTLGYGGGLYMIHRSTPAGDMIVANCTFHGNSADATLGGGAIGEPWNGELDIIEVMNTIAWGDSHPEVTGSAHMFVDFCDIEGTQYCSFPNMCVDPLFVNMEARVAFASNRSLPRITPGKIRSFN